MLKHVRGKVASSLSDIEPPENFNWQKWLRPVQSEFLEVEPFYYKLLNTDHLNKPVSGVTSAGYEFILPECSLTNLNIIYVIKRVKSNAVFFGIARPEHSKVDPARGFSTELPESIEVILTHPQILTDYNVLSKPKQFRIRYHFKETPVIDKFASLKPEIIEINLLSIDETSSEHLKISEIQFKSINEIPKLHNYQIEDLSNLKIPASVSIKARDLKSVTLHTYALQSFQEPAVLSSDLVLDKVKIRKASAKSLNSFSVSTKSIPEMLKELEPKRKLSDEDRDRLLSVLSEYQRKDAVIISSENNVILAGDTGIDNRISVVYALKIFFMQNDIRNVLVVCDSRFLFSSPINEQSYLRYFWPDIFKSEMPKQKMICIKGDIETRKKLWKEKAHVKICDFSTLLSDVNSKLTGDQQGYDCIIIDQDADRITKETSLINKIIEQYSPIYRIIMTSVTDYTSLQELKNNFDAEPVITINERKNISTVDFPAQNIFLWDKMDETQISEYEEALKKGQENIYFLIDEGNPMRIQANMFTLIHQLTQIMNFPAGKAQSPKAETLISQIGQIISNDQKCLLLSQYEKAGTKKIEKLLAANGIPYISQQQGMTQTEINQLVRQFNNDKQLRVFLASSKSAKVRWDLTDLSCIIHYDRWWNPVSVWNTEDNVQTKKLTSVSLLTKNSIEEKIYTILSKKGLLNRNIFQMLPADYMNSFFTFDDWVDVLQLDEKLKSGDNFSSEKISEFKLPQMSRADITDKTKSLFMLLGYNNILIEDSGKKNVISVLRGTQNRSGLEQNVIILICKESKFSASEINDLIDEYCSTEADKLFIITPSANSVSLSISMPENVSLIDGTCLYIWLHYAGILK